MILGSYCLHLYCDNPACNHGRDLRKNFIEIASEDTKQRAKKLAKRLGWHVGTKTVLCPICIPRKH